MHIYTSITISEKRSQEFEGEQGGLYGKVWRGEKEGRNVLITR